MFLGPWRLWDGHPTSSRMKSPRRPLQSVSGAGRAGAKSTAPSLLICVMAVAFAPLLVLCASLARPQAAVEADQLYTGGQDPSRERRGLAVLEAALAGSPDDYELLWRAARACYGVTETSPPEEREGGFERAVRYGERAVLRAPGRVEGHFWLGAAWG